MVPTEPRRIEYLSNKGMFGRLRTHLFRLRCQTVDSSPTHPLIDTGLQAGGITPPSLSRFTAFVVVPAQPVSIDKIPELLNKPADMMMFLLARHVSSDLADIGFRDRERAIASPPREFPR
jgi:hypothetical protein